MSKPKLIIGDMPVATNEDGLISLTDLWKMSGGVNTNHPTMWIKNDSTQEFVAACSKNLKVENSQLMAIRRGKGGGTYAHWQIALAYAKWLSPELHMKVNETYIRYKSGDATLAEEIIDKVKNPEDLKRIEARARNVRSNKALNGAIANCGGEQKTYAVVGDINNVAVTGKTAKQLREDNNLPAKASTRPLLDTSSMVVMAFIEELEMMSLEKGDVKGHKPIVSTCSEVASSVKDLVTKHSTREL